MYANPQFEDFVWQMGNGEIPNSEKLQSHSTNRPSMLVAVSNGNSAGNKIGVTYCCDFVDIKLSCDVIKQGVHEVQHPDNIYRSPRCRDACKGHNVRDKYRNMIKRAICRPVFSLSATLFGNNSVNSNSNSQCFTRQCDNIKMMIKILKK